MTYPKEIPEPTQRLLDALEASSPDGLVGLVAFDGTACQLDGVFNLNNVIHLLTQEGYFNLEPKD